jgi:hypothetical protein
LSYYYKATKPIINAITNAYIATASANAIVRIVKPWILPAASGFLPKASKAPLPIKPIPIPGQIAPKPIATAIANSFNSIIIKIKL